MEISNNQGFSFDLPKGNSSIIKVIGVGGGGNNALKYMYEKGINGVDFVICNTDAQTLDNNPISNKVQLGVAITEGLGAGADPEVGEKAALESIDDIKASLGSNTKMVFITAGMGGGTGTGAAPVIAKVAKEMGILTIAIVTVPFNFEGKRRLDQAENGLEKLRANVDSLIVINNDKLRQQFGNLGFKSGFSKADEVLANAAKGMAEVITGYFDVNIDFRDARSVLKDSGTALMSTGIASGENKAEEAVRKALDSPLLNDNKITGAKNVLLLIRSGSEEVTMDEIGVVMDHIQKETGNTADIIFGVGTDEELGEEVSVLVIATGFSPEDQKYSGPTETIRYKLEDEETSSKTTQAKETVVETSQETKETVSNTIIEQEAIRFHLEEEIEEKQPEFPVFEEKNRIVEEEVDQNQIMDFGFFDDREEDVLFSIKEEEEEKPIEFNLFSIEEDFTASVVNKEIEKPQEKPQMSFSQEVEIKVEETTIPKVENKIQEQKVVEEIVEAKKTTMAEEFNIVEKDREEINRKAIQRKNKLKEFNSRYESYDKDHEFETIPAFRRKNININSDNPSDQNISNFLFEDQFGMKLKENKFLNKDVD